MNARQFKEAAKEFYCGVISITVSSIRVYGIIIPPPHYHYCLL